MQTDPEVVAIQAIVDILAPLTDDQRAAVLAEINGRVPIQTDDLLTTLDHLDPDDAPPAAR